MTAKEAIDALERAYEFVKDVSMGRQSNHQSLDVLRDLTLVQQKIVRRARETTIG